MLPRTPFTRGLATQALNARARRQATKDAAAAARAAESSVAKVQRTQAEWTRPLPEGELPVYDLALDIIHKDSERLTKQAEAIKAQLARRPTDSGLAKRLDRLQVLSQVNIPAVKWSFDNHYGALDSWTRFRRAHCRCSRFVETHIQALCRKKVAGAREA